MTTTHTALSVGSVWDVPRFPSVDACMAIGCNTQWLTGLISASPVVYPLGRDEVVERVKRRMFLFKFRTVFHLALMRAISSVLPLAVARDLSRVCVEADHLFPADLVSWSEPRYLVIAPGSRVSKMVVAGAFETELTVEELASVGDDPAEPRIVLDVTAIFDQVVEGLRLGGHTGRKARPV